MMIEAWQLFEHLGLPQDVVDGARPFGSDLERLWYEMDGTGWRLLFLGQIGVDPRWVVRATVAFLRASADGVCDESDPAVQAVLLWADGQLEMDEFFEALEEAEVPFAGLPTWFGGVIAAYQILQGAWFGQTNFLPTEAPDADTASRRIRESFRAAIPYEIIAGSVADLVASGPH